MKNIITFFILFSIQFTMLFAQVPPKIVKYGADLEEELKIVVGIAVLEDSEEKWFSTKDKVSREFDINAKRGGIKVTLQIKSNISSDTKIQVTISNVYIPKKQFLLDKKLKDVGYVNLNKNEVTELIFPINKTELNSNKIRGRFKLGIEINYHEISNEEIILNKEINIEVPSKWLKTKNIINNNQPKVKIEKKTELKKINKDEKNELKNLFQVLLSKKYNNNDDIIKNIKKEFRNQNKDCNRLEGELADLWEALDLHIQDKICESQDYVESEHKSSVSKEDSNVSQMLNSEKEWIEVKSTNSIGILKNYRRNYPNAHKEEVEAKIRALEQDALKKRNEEQQAWAKAKTNDNIKGYNDYLLNYPRGEHRSHASQRIRDLSNLVAAEPKIVENTAIITIIKGEPRREAGEYFDLSPTDNIGDSEPFSKIRENSKWIFEKGKYSLVIENLEVEKNYQFYIVGQGDNKVLITFQKEIEPFDVNYEGSTGDSYVFEIRGGKPPYLFIVNNGDLNKLKVQSDIKYYIESEKYNLKEGSNIKFRDSNHEWVSKEGITIGGTTTNWLLWLSIVLVVLLLLGGYIMREKIISFLYKKNNNYEPSKHQAIAQERLAGINNTVTTPSQTGGNVSKIKIKKKENYGGIQLQKRKIENGVNETNLLFQNIMNNSSYYQMDLKTLWKDTAVSEVYIELNCASKIDYFVENEGFSKDNETGVIPEIGGFLLGYYELIPNMDTYRVSLEKFVPVTPERNGLYQIKFGTKAWQEYDMATQRYADLNLIGWFHTHPGHGLFLSTPDISIHEGFFKEPYQFAMEQDPNTEEIDTAFFTRKQNGSLNNTTSELDQNWFKWTDFQRWRRSNRKNRNKNRIT
ncbi:MAG: hypothetical protein R3E32_01515 [Chitinophagales bacterium]